MSKMRIFLSAVAMYAAFGLALGGAANAAVYSYTGFITLCTGTCASFASLALGSEISATVEINTAPSSAFGDADIGSILGSAFNPALPVSGPVGDPVNDNPLLIDSALGTIASNGSSGMTDANNQIISGQLVLEFLVPPFSSNAAFMIIDLATGTGQVCLFYAAAGCIPGATQAGVFEGSLELVPIPAAVWLFGSALLGIFGLGRRKPA